MSDEGPATIQQIVTAALAPHYQVEREIGVGGMATVFLARDVRHERDVAIKVLNPEIGAVLGAERFLREIKTTANLRHPHIVPLYDSGEVKLSPTDAGGGPPQLLYYVMPLVEGESLRERLARETQLSVDEALRITREVAGGLAHAHARGVVHRDVKPDNIMLENGHAVIADFGIARAVNAASGERMTQTGMAVGTPMYMSPEQAAGECDLDGRSDEYALACVAFEMLAGQPPFTGPNAMAITRQHMIVDAPSISNLRAGVPPSVVSALRRALSKAPADRFDTVAEFAAALDAPSPSGDVNDATLAAATRTSTSSRRVAILGAIVVLIALGILGFFRRGKFSGGAGGATAASIAVLPFSDLSADKANVFFGDGVAETLINALASVPGLTVAARTSAFAFRNRGGELAEIARQLHVANILEGSVQRAGAQLRITARVIRTNDGQSLWSQTFDRSSADIFAVQDEVARSVVSALRLTLGSLADSGTAATTTHSPEAYDAYLLGRYHWNRRTTDGMIEATAAFSKAIALDSSYAQAWSGLADAYVLSIPNEYNVPGLNPDTALRRAESAARRAIALAPELGEAYASLGEILTYRNRYPEAMKAFERGIALSPTYATGHQWYSYALSDYNRWTEAIAEMESAHRLDPLSHVITLSVAIAYDGADRFAEASPLYAQGFAQSPEAWYAWSAMVGHEFALGHPDSAFAAFRTALKGNGVLAATVSRLERSLRDPATRRAATDELGRTGMLYLGVTFSRWLSGDDATLAFLDSMAAARVTTPGGLFIYQALGPKLSGSPRVNALASRFGWPPQREDHAPRP
ncbi:hypothetical protein BH09GEM1_BH09GEM1_37690 [soil metagenome]